MKTFTGYVTTGCVGAKVEFDFEVEDDATEDQIEQAAREAMFECIDWGYDNKAEDDDA